MDVLVRNKVIKLNMYRDYKNNNSYPCKAQNNLFRVANCYTIKWVFLLRWENDSQYVYFRFIGVANHFLTLLANSDNHIF